LENYKCAKCRDLGFIPIKQENAQDVIIECECHKKDKLLRMWEKSGIKLENQNLSFENYKPITPMAKHMKAKAIQYFTEFDNIKGSRHNSIAFLGQVGSGKTHLTVSIAGRLINKGVEVRYFQFREMITYLKQNIMDEEAYQREVTRYKTTPVLLIDDLFKKQKDKGTVTDSDVKIMFEIVNYRYVNYLPIIVSSELSVDEILDIDEGLGSRVVQMCKQHLVQVEGMENNYRLKE
jgi:DNA replication protein DnaC